MGQLRSRTAAPTTAVDCADSQLPLYWLYERVHLVIEQIGNLLGGMELERAVLAAPTASIQRL